MSESLGKTKIHSLGKSVHVCTLYVSWYTFLPMFYTQTYLQNFCLTESGYRYGTVFERVGAFEPYKTF